MVKLALPIKLEDIEDVESQIANDEGEMPVLCKAECNSENVWNCYSNYHIWPESRKMLDLPPAPTSLLIAFLIIQH